MDDEHGEEYRPDEGTSAQINIGQTIQGGMLMLITDIATVDAGLKFNNLAPVDFQQFYSHFLALFVTAQNHLAPATVEPIEAFFRDAANLGKNEIMTAAAKKATNLALSMKKDLELRGLWQVFAPLGEPPFNMDEIK